MAGSRLERFGTVFTRVRDLMRSGVIKPPKKPIWYDVYEAFPPTTSLHVKPHTRPCTKKQETVPEIFYREDEVRAFVDKYTELKSHSEMDDSALFEETGKALLRDGIVLRRRGAPSVSAETRDPVLELKLTDMLTEQRSVSADSEDTMEHTTHKP
ncbi:28S ribosomal protein S23, mitochondrial isoform X3 [Siniperca chuatsi]|uniref:28S ribosomal protein S23, mitochondrial isoform X3 n=1 Tax=Siniperca chuatsi TaxID=119488 RepID=UPI001CE1A41D|nr:28S ribosomal protein S23, mitochondrial isoform X3 [Siniperca chuatsi]